MIVALSGSPSRADPLHLSEIVLPDRSEDHGHAPCELVQLHASDLLTKLLPRVVDHHQPSASSVEVLARTATTSRAWVLRYADARAVVALLGESFMPGSGSRPVDDLHRGGTTA